MGRIIAPVSLPELSSPLAYFADFPMSGTAKKQAPRIARPAARYWKGKAPKGVVEVDSDSEEEDEQPELDADGDVPIGGDQEFDQDDEEPDETASRPVKSMNIALKDVNISNGRVIVGGRDESGRTQIEQEEGMSHFSNTLNSHI